MSAGNRTPIILGVIAGVLAVAVAVTLVIAFTRGGGDPAPSPTTTTTATTPDAPAASESPAATGEPTEITLAATGFTVQDDAGESVFVYRWNDDAAPAVAALTEAFGAEPTERVEEGNGTTYPDYTVYQWTGFALYDMIPIDGGTPRDEYSQPSYLRYTADTVGDIAIIAEFDLAIALTLDEVRALGPDEEGARGDGFRLVFAADRSGVEDGVPSYSVIVDTDADAVTAIYSFYFAGL